MIKQGPVSFFFLVFASSELAFGFLQGQGFNSPLAFGQIMAIILLIFGLVGWLFSMKISKHPMPGVALQTSEKEQLNIVIGVVLGLFLFILSNKFVPVLSVASASVVNVYTFFGTFTMSTASLGAATSAFLFTVILIPTAEENFFRGFWANLTIASMGKFAGIVVQAIIFMLFHIPADGWTITLGVIFADGLIIGAIAEQTGRLETGILAHVGNNFLAYVVVTGSVVVSFPLFAGVPLSQVLSLPLLLGVWGFVRVRKGLPVFPSLRGALRL